uniref:Protein PLANT CADMIUM RESISTANCE 8 n=1 Tax=Noccaea caerulescens TaxID=107243 RepID=A0A1J3IQF8_NOCCA
MGRVTTPPGENPNNGFPVQQTGTPIHQTGVPVSQFAPPNYHQANVNLSVGSPWRTGWNGILAQRQGQYESEAPSFAPPNQYMSK